MGNDITFVGLDVSKATISVGLAPGDRRQSASYFGNIAYQPAALDSLCRKLSRESSCLHFCYEAGPFGYGLHRQLTEWGHACEVVAPSLIPKRPGDRVKTDRRDALSLATLLRAGQLTAVWVPDASHEAMRTLARLRWLAAGDVVRAKQQTYRYPARQSYRLRNRSSHLPEPIRDKAWQAQTRLCRRLRDLRRRGKPHNVALAAVARELAGHVWAIARMVPTPTA